MNLPALLANRLQQPLPGRAAQQQFEPEGAEGRHFQTPASPRAAAVIALLYPHQDGWRLPLTVRPDTLAAHPGQISFPGGAVETGESTGQAALRELDEELGVPPSEVELLGPLSPLYVFASRFLVQPWLGLARAEPRWRPSPEEVAEVLEVPLAHLADGANHAAHQLFILGRDRSVPHIEWQGHRIWGATSMILAELIQVWREATADESGN